MAEVEKSASVAPLPVKIPAHGEDLLPEVNAGAEPVVVIVARSKWFSREQSLSNGELTTVVRQNKTVAQSVQRSDYR